MSGGSVLPDEPSGGLDVIVNQEVSHRRPAVVLSVFEFYMAPSASGSPRHRACSSCPVCCSCPGTGWRDPSLERCPGSASPRQRPSAGTPGLAEDQRVLPRPEVSAEQDGARPDLLGSSGYRNGAQLRHMRARVATPGKRGVLLNQQHGEAPTRKVTRSVDATLSTMMRERP